MHLFFMPLKIWSSMIRIRKTFLARIGSRAVANEISLQPGKLNTDVAPREKGSSDDAPDSVIHAPVGFKQFVSYGPFA